MSSDQRTVILSFDGVTPDEGNRYAGDLRDFLADIDSRVQVEQRRERPDSRLCRPTSAQCGIGR